MSTRAETTGISRYVRSIDRPLVIAVGMLMVAGLIFGIAASPAIAEKHRLSTFFFVHRQAVWMLLAVGVMAAVSLLEPRQLRRLSLVLFLGSLAAVLLVLAMAPEIKGSRRWLHLPMLGSLQPSEFLKPAFIILVAWAFSEGAKRQGMPGTVLAAGLLVISVVPLVLQPDIGQTSLLVAVWCGLFFLAGLHMVWVVGLGGLAAAALVLAYRYVPHVAARLDKFLFDTGAQDTFQVDAALESFRSGGFWGRGPGEGVLKQHVPDAHTDFIFAVIGEEFGIVAAIAIVALYAFVVLRGLALAFRCEDPFCRFAAAGLAMLLGLQALINLLVNVHLLPPKGMTLPFISYGGSSLISLAFAVGALLAVSRRRPEAGLLLRGPERQPQLAAPAPTLAPVTGRPLGVPR